MKHPIDGIEAFIQIAELGSFNKAAEKLHVTQTGLTRRIQRLEAHVGLKLIDRTTRTVALTSIGREFLPEAQRMVDAVDRSFERLKTMSRFSTGDITIASVPSLMYGRLPRILRSYATRHPSNRVEILDRTSTLVIEAVRRRQAEFGLHVQPPNQPDLHNEVLVRDPFVVYCRNDHPLAGRPAIAWADLAGHDLITLGGSSGNRLLMEAQLSRSGIEVKTRFVVEYFSSAIGLASEGLGIAILVASLVENLRPDLAQIPLVDPIVDRPVSLIRRRGETLTPAAQALYNLIVRDLGPL
ncbi:DNA-binding transcriptional regulator, LysR family OS=Bosea thiooxidans OX=53254 GN=SAMN05660750_04257 PE=3 SV=1 [Bosea thiooxidans]|uniref:DNA-binding transcriptional regulator, LysR family n=1 Tax=Bosea thiooxidans TaxID=53254 RepID=A0A1T5GPC5_9HYPH|nr:LysR family transcriptional regulator [Bosea thiooxidans]SKC10294.1 DNA-binding transcriptional regulator, LysR family [Bosea thiooxidans]